jgi:hypothetical protein
MRTGLPAGSIVAGVEIEDEGALLPKCTLGTFAQYVYKINEAQEYAGWK